MLSEFNYELIFQDVKRLKYFNYSLKAKIGSKLMNEYTLILKKHFSNQHKISSHYPEN